MLNFILRRQTVTRIPTTINPLISKLNSFYIHKYEKFDRTDPTLFSSTRLASTSNNNNAGFFAPDNVTFSSLNLDERVCSSLQAAGFDRPAQVQQLSASAIIDGKDIVLAAETGSGKTMAYLAPLVHLTLANKLDNPPLEDDTIIDNSKENNTTDIAWFNNNDNTRGEEEEEVKEGRSRNHRTGTLILCPNAPLCQQVMAVLDKAFLDPATGEPLVTSYLVSSQSNPPPILPDIVVSTPGALVSLLDGAGTLFGEDWTRTGFSGWVRHVVLDEADLLLSGGYSKHLNIIMEALRSGDRDKITRRVCAELSITEEEFHSLPRLLKKAARRGGGAAMLEEGFTPPEHYKSNPYQLHQEILPWLRQYIFVAATMPIEGGKSVGQDIAEAFPSIEWLSGEQLHKTKRNVVHDWKCVFDDDDRLDTLQSILENDQELSKGQGRALIFTRDVASATKTAEALQQRLTSSDTTTNIKIMQYHRNIPVLQRGTVLQRMSQEDGVVMVCTDAAARGIDLPDVTHVIQADFATSAMDFIHRIGRTARAGKDGRVTSLYHPDVRPLVDAMRAAAEAGKPVEGAFSRNRSFRKKFRRYGEYVPRGQVGPSSSSSSDRE